MPFLSPVILSIISPFSILFSFPVWKRCLTLFSGAILCRGKRTVCAALRVMGLDHEKHFSSYHHVLNRVKWSPLYAAKILLCLIVKVTGTQKSLVLFIDETLERRKGPKIKAKGYYRDAVRSSKQNIVKTSGLKWLSLSACCRFSFSNRYFALPFMTVLEPSAKSDKKANKRHKTTLQWTIQMLLQIVRWLKNTSIILVGDGGFACGALAWRCIKLKIALISRLKMNACLYDFPQEINPSKRGRRRTKGDRLYSFKKMLELPDLGWKEITVEGYEQKKKVLKYITNVSLWGADGFRAVPIRWVLVVDPMGDLDPMPLMCTDLMVTAETMITLYFRRWNIEVTFEEVREHLGIETQRQWSDKAIARTTPILMSFYTIVCLICNRLAEEQPIVVAQTAWYEKKDATFSDLLKTVRKMLWRDNLIFRKPAFEPFPKKNKSLNDSLDDEWGILEENWWIKTLIEHLSA